MEGGERGRSSFTLSAFAARLGRDTHIKSSPSTVLLVRLKPPLAAPAPAVLRLIRPSPPPRPFLEAARPAPFCRLGAAGRGPAGRPFCEAGGGGSSCSTAGEAALWSRRRRGRPSSSSFPFCGANTFPFLAYFSFFFYTKTFCP